jgi:hypothetical protein
MMKSISWLLKNHYFELVGVLRGSEGTRREYGEHDLILHGSARMVLLLPWL